MKTTNYAILIIYIAMSLLIGEFHPFSRYKMYDSFPETALTFSLTDAHGVLIPLQKYYDYKTADVSHNYEAAHIAAADEKKPPNEYEIGKALFSQLSDYRFRPLEADTVKLNKTELYFYERKLKGLTTTIYEYHQ